MKNEITIGQATITLDSVSISRISQEDGGVWISGTAEVSWAIEYRGQTRTGNVTVKVGCWADTNDDHQIWSAVAEGCRVIAACVGAAHDCEDNAGTFLRMAFADECKYLGVDICEMLRAEVEQVS